MGTVVMVVIAAMVVSIGAVLAHKSDTPQRQPYGFGQLRSYAGGPPDTAWTRGIDDLPGFSSSGGSVTVADTHGGTWLLAYPSGLGRAFLAVDRRDGAPRWDKPVTVGLGSCAFNGVGQVACAIKVGNVPDGYYLVDEGIGAGDVTVVTHANGGDSGDAAAISHAEIREAATAIVPGNCRRAKAASRVIGNRPPRTGRMSAVSCANDSA